MLSIHLRLGLPSGLYTHTLQHKLGKDANDLSSLEWRSNQRTDTLSRQGLFMPYFGQCHCQILIRPEKIFYILYH
jgi:hypothetical protein